MSFSISGWPCCLGVVIVVLVIIMIAQKNRKEKDEDYRRKLDRNKKTTSQLKSELEDLKEQVENSQNDDDADAVNVTE
jgi:sensor domain CHASE-containing protein